MARPCPVCTYVPRTSIFSMGYKTPDQWPLPSEITWYTCNMCGMLYGDGEFNQAMLNEFYTKYYGYGVSNPDNQARLKADAQMIRAVLRPDSVIVDFGGAGDDGRSVIQEELMGYGFTRVSCIGPNEELPEQAHVIYASHVLEHIYDLPKTMKRLTDSLAPDGLLVVDVPDSMGLLNRWKMPILDFNTKHINHFTMRTLLELGRVYGLEGLGFKWYELEYAPCIQVHFRKMEFAYLSSLHISENMYDRKKKLKEITQPVNIWGLGDVVWHLMTLVKLDVLDYIDNDPAFRGQTYNGKPILERPTNDAPILIIAQGQRKRLIENIRKMGVKNEILEI